MRTIKMDVLPKCSFCDKKADFDGKTYTGSWAYMCKMHFEEYAIQTQIGACLKQKSKKAKIKKAKDVVKNCVEMSSIEEMMLGDREISCPDCGDSRMMEIDADGVVDCDECGIKIRIRRVI